MSEKVEIRVPDIGDFRDVEIIEVLAAAGDQVAAEQSLLVLETEKATVEVPCAVAGTVVEMLVKVGEKVSEGTPYVIVEAEIGAGVSTRQNQNRSEPAGEPEVSPPKPEKQQSPEPSAPREAPQKAVDAGAAGGQRLPHASPAVRRFARSLGLDLGSVQGTARGGRITRQDVEREIKSRLSDGGGGAVPGLQVAPAPQVDFAKYGPVRDEPLNRIQKISGAALHRNWVRIPHVTQHDDADITEMEAFRKSLAAEGERRGIRLTPVAFLVAAVVAALREFPTLNASLNEDGERLIVKDYFHIGVAVDTPHGLVVPVVRDCDRKGIWSIAEELATISGRAREGKLAPEEMRGGSFTISSLGGIGGSGFTPIINAPEVAILGVSRASWKPVYNQGVFDPRLMLPLSLSYDHRVIDGATGVRFTRYLAQILGDLRHLAMVR